ncbi:MAG: carboxypeptidase regulatory-like domain-containing protein [Burkholderiaceae bacterium]|nr:carboxypeptidase regulatory-like domain-containing protein [Burkholderiaceae bacterium]
MTGVARYFNGAGYYSASWAKVEAAGKSATTDSNGNYRIDGLPAGKVDVLATFSNYPSIQASFTAQDGHTVEFSPVFQHPPSSSAVLTVQVTDGKTGKALQGALVQLRPPSHSRNTDAQGRAIFASGYLLAGNNTVIVSHAGYERATLSVNAVDGQNILLTVSLQPTTGSQTVLRGVVTDADTLQPLAGVQVLVVEAQMQTVTDAQGAYTLTDAKLAGSRTVEFSKAGYLMHSQAISIAGAVVNVFNVPLRADAVTPGPARLDVTVVERGTGQPVSGAQVKLSGSNQRSVVVDAAGLASVANLNPGEMQIAVSAPGFESAVASVNVKAGQTYVMPVELLWASSPIHKLYGHIVDAVSQQPISAAQVVLTGAAAGTATTAANGYYEFANVALGDVQITVTANGYLTAQRDFRMDGTTEAKLALTPSWQTGSPSTWSVVGSVVDADTLTPIVGADLVLEEVLPGSAVVSVQKAATQTGGSLAFDGLKETNARLTLSMNGYDTSVVPLARQGSSQSLGVIKLKRSYNAALPDLMLGMADRSSLLQDASTFKATGKVTARVTNNSNYDATGFDVIAFLDADGDQIWNPATDTLLGKTRVGALSAQQSLLLEWDLHEAPLPFRDAPIHLMADSGLEVIENIEGNNTLRVGVTCSGGGGVQDVGICIDTSGSVAHLYNLEMEGVIKAVENPNIIPHDGSIRFMLGTDAEMYYGTGIPLHTARILTPATLPQLIQDLKSKNSYGGGYSSGPTCVRRMSEYMKTLPKLAGSKTVITVGDGYWEGIPAANAQLPVTVANGVSRVDVIGVGSVNLPELEANAWPKPVNSLRGGRVTVAYSSGDVAAAMAQALGSAVQSVDLTLGGFRMIDQGQGNPVALHARVGNGGVASQPTAVRWYQGANLLGETAVPAMRSGGWLDVTLNTAATQGAEDLIAVVDEQHVNPECNTGNNQQRLAMSPSNRLGSLMVRTDKTVYQAQAQIQLSGVVENLGLFPARFSIVFSVLDARRDEVHRFAAVDVGTLAAKSPYTHVQQWNTSTLPAGSYHLEGSLLDQDGIVVAQGSAPFTIIAGNSPGGPKATLTVAVDRAVYAPDDRVRISSLSRNLTLNAALDDARVRITVRDPSSTVVYRYMHTNGQLTANAVRANDTQQTLKGAMLGKYTVEAVLIGSGNNLKTATLAGKQGKAYDVEVELASATTTFEVKAGAVGGPGNPGVPGAPGAVSAVPIDQPWFLWLMAVGLAWVARRRLRPGAQQTPSGPLAH